MVTLAENNLKLPRGNLMNKMYPTLRIITCSCTVCCMPVTLTSTMLQVILFFNDRNNASNLNLHSRR